MDYLVYAYLQLGHDEKAKAVVDEMATLAGLEIHSFGCIIRIIEKPGNNR